MTLPCCSKSASIWIPSNLILQVQSLAFIWLLQEKVLFSHDSVYLLTFMFEHHPRRFHSSQSSIPTASLDTKPVGPVLPQLFLFIFINTSALMQSVFLNVFAGLLLPPSSQWSPCCELPLSLLSWEQLLYQLTCFLTWLLHLRCNLTLSFLTLCGVGFCAPASFVREKTLFSSYSPLSLSLSYWCLVTGISSTLGTEQEWDQLYNSNLNLSDFRIWPKLQVCLYWRKLGRNGWSRVGLISSVRWK